jgi:hypothetical protein
MDHGTVSEPHNMQQTVKILSTCIVKTIQWVDGHIGVKPQLTGNICSIVIATKERDQRWHTASGPTIKNVALQQFFILTRLH